MHVVVAMSGGVDSSVAAALLAERGHRVTGVFLRNGVHAGPRAATGKQGCCSVGDSQDAARVADLLGVPFYALDFAAEFDRIVDDFASEYARGRTPNPCVTCNRDLKLGRLLSFADALGADAVATGHYARREEAAGRQILRTAEDGAKDQTYVLFPLGQEALARTLFPLGDLQKEHVRALAREHGLPVHAKPESMEICFVPEGDYRAILETRAPDALRPGPIVDGATGAVLGTHSGVGGVTIGQRKGLRIAAAHPLYVTAIDVPANTVVVGRRDDVLRRVVEVDAWNAVSVPAPERPLRCLAKVRRGHEPQAATIAPAPGGARRFDVTFDDPVSAPAPGQALVAYDTEGRVLGGGWIASSRT
jgi:tRNA-specific 2-thiouridylase